MTISSVAPSAPISSPPVTEPQTPQVKNETSADDANAYQPPPPAPLPPGQGTRIDQLV
jgi:hypothetical protein